MKKKNKKKNIYKYDNKRFILVFTMMFCLVISMSTYWMYAYKHKYGKNYFDNKIISYKVSDYVDTDGNYVYLKNIDKEIINTFINKQKEVLKNNVIDMSVTKGIYKDILSIKISYVLYGELSNYEDVITINIDLKNNKVLSNDDMIDMVKGSYKTNAPYINLLINRFKFFLPSFSSPEATDLEKSIRPNTIKPIGTAIKAILRSNLIKYITLSTPTLVQASIVSAKTILILNNIKLIILNSKYLYLLIFYLTL